jgi:predicted RNA binding protein YcfA (HicA-like mRNA interferase family)
MSSEKILKSMRQNKRDWEIKDLMVVAKTKDIECSHRDGSHYVFKHDKIKNNLSIPRHKDLHPDYITKFLRMIDEIAELEKQEAEKAE